MITEINLTDGTPLNDIQRAILKMALDKGYDIAFAPNYETQNHETVLYIDDLKDEVEL